MKNKKGFTLVELLAVIAILAILVIIALPNVMGMFNNAKRSTFITEAQKIYQQITTDFVNDNLKSAGERVYCYEPAENNQSNVESAGCSNTSADSTAKEKMLNMNTTKSYYAEVDSSGNVGVFVVYDKSFYIAFDGNTKKVEKVTDIKEPASTDAMDISKLTSNDGLKVKTGTKGSVSQSQSGS